MTNKFEGHPEVSRKHDLFKNIRSYMDGPGAARMKQSD